MNPEEYRGGWNVIGAIRDVGRGGAGLVVWMGKLKGTSWKAGGSSLNSFPADIVFTDLGLLVVVKGHGLMGNQAAALPTSISSEAGSLSSDQVQQAYESLPYDDVKDVRIMTGGPLGRWIEKRAGRPVCKVCFTRRSRVGIPVVAVEFDGWMSPEEVRAFLERTPLAPKIRGAQ